MPEIPKGARYDVENETISFPKRGRPPMVDPAIWEPIEGDEFQFQLSLVECLERNIQLVERPCRCPPAPRPVCNVLNIPVTRSICYKCQGNPEWIKEKFA